MHKQAPYLINLFAGPGAGKSTLAAGLFYRMKQLGYNVELAAEYCKDLVYEGRKQTMKNQPYIFGKQYNRIQRLAQHVDFIVTDSPLLFSLVYVDESTPASFAPFVMDVHNTFHNINYFVERTKPYVAIGRNQTEAEAKNLDGNVRLLLHNYQLPYKMVHSSDKGIETILEDLRDLV